MNCILDDGHTKVSFFLGAGKQSRMELSWIASVVLAERVP